MTESAGEAAERRFDRAWAKARAGRHRDMPAVPPVAPAPGTAAAVRQAALRLALRRRAAAVAVPACARAPRVIAPPLHHSPAPCALAFLQARRGAEMPGHDQTEERR